MHRSFVAICTYILFGILSTLHGQNAWITGVVSDEFGNLPGAKVVLVGTTYSDYTDVNGKFSLEVDPGVYSVRSSFIFYLNDVREISLVAGDSLYLDIELQSGFSVDQPVALGTRAQPRSLLETVVPVDVISPQQISNSSKTSIGDILHYLTPSFHSVSQTISDGTDFIDPATLRGLGPDQVLVLVNGKRRHNSSLLNVNGTVGRGTVGTDFNAIPVAAVDRIEILRDGAASQYGSDAIAGVVNIILKEKTGIIDIDTRIGGNIEGDGLTRYSAANYGLEIGDRGFINLTAEYRDRQTTSRAGNYTGAVYSRNPEEDARLITQNNFFAQHAYRDQVMMEIGNAATQNLGFFFNGEIRLAANVRFYGHGGRNFREGLSKGFYRFPFDTAKVVHELFPNGFSPQILANIQDESLTLGVRGEKGDWLLDFSVSNGANKFDYTIENSNNASLGLASPTVFYAGGFVYNQNTLNLDISRSFDWLKGTNLAFGSESRTENYQIISGEEASWVNGGDSVVLSSDNIIRRVPGAQVFPGLQPDNELNKFRTNFSWYVDVEANLTKRWLVELAGRYQIYNDFDEQAIWKFATAYRIKDKLNLRGAISTGFRAPSLHQVYFNNISTQFENGIAKQVGTFNNESAVANAFNIKPLKPELSRHLSAGLTTKINEKLTFTFDYYSILIEDRIVLSGRFEEGYEALLSPFNVDAAQFFTNAIDSKTSGADMVIFYKKSLADGSLEASLAANLTKTRLVNDIKVPLGLEGQESVLYNREEVSRVESVQPNFKISSMVAYKRGTLHAELRNTVFGRVKYVHPDDANQENWVVNSLTGVAESRDQTFSPKVITDFLLSKQLTDNLRFAIGGNNIFNIFPDRHQHSANIDNGNFVYSRRVQQFGVAGAYYYGRFLISL